MSKKTLSAKVSPKTMDRLDEYADEEEVSRSEATQRLLKQGLDLEDTDTMLVSTDGGEKIEDSVREVNQAVEGLSDDIDTLVTIANSIKSLQGAIQKSALVSLIGLLFILAELSIGLSPIMILVVGIPLAIAGFYYSYQVSQL